MHQLHRQLGQLKQKIIFVGSMVEGAIANAIYALINRDEHSAKKVIAEDIEIDRMEVDVEEECLKLLALYQPVAADLRFIVAALKINNDLERMGDLAESIAKRVVALGKTTLGQLPVDFRPMAIKAQDMVKRSLDSLVNSDTSLAQQVRHDDDALDAMRKQLQERLVEDMRKNPAQIEPLMMLYSVAKHLERLGDMATHVAEEVIYLVEGAIVRHSTEP